MLHYLEDIEDDDLEDDMGLGLGMFHYGFSKAVDALDTVVGFLPEWPPTWLREGPPDWMVDFAELNFPDWPQQILSGLSQHGMPHVYIQQNVCEKAFDVGILILTLGALLLFAFIFRRWLRPPSAPPDKHGFCPECAEKSEVLSEDLVNVEKRVDLIRSTCQNVSKSLQGCLQGKGTDGPALEKRLKKMPDMLLSNSMSDSASALGEQSVLGNVLEICGKSQKLLSNELLEYEVAVEKDVINKELEIIEVDIPSIVKMRKHLAKLTLDMDSAKTRYHTAARHSLQMQASGGGAAKVDVIKEEMEDASNKVEQCRDGLSAEMFALISRESELAHHLVALVKAQAHYHKKAGAILDKYTQHMEEEIHHHPSRPVYHCPLVDHLRVTGRQIALPIEVCACFLLESGFSEEGIFRVAGSASKVKKLKAAFDAGLFDIIDMSDYEKDPHAVAGALKSYLRELPIPLMTHELYNDWLGASKVSDIECRLQALKDVLKRMPEPYARNLRYLIKYLAKLTTNQETNKMSSQNLAIVIAPNLIWAPNEQTNMGLNMSLANSYSTIVDHLISNADWFFPGEIEFYITCPLPKSPHEGGFSAEYGDDLPANGELELHSSLQPHHEGPYSNHSSPGSPKSLRRSKKPPPPVPPALKEKPTPSERPAFLAEKPIPSERSALNADKPAVLAEKSPPLAEKPPPHGGEKPVPAERGGGERLGIGVERTVIDRTPMPEKMMLERKLSAPLEADKPLLPSKTNNIERSQSHLVHSDKPVIPEKPSLDKKSSMSADLLRYHTSASATAVTTNGSAFSAAETSSAEKTFVQTLPSEKEKANHHQNQSHTANEADLNGRIEPTFEPLPSPEVEPKPERDRRPVFRRGRSPKPLKSTDSFDMYRPSWYGAEDEDDSGMSASAAAETSITKAQPILLPPAAPSAPKLVIPPSFVLSPTVVHSIRSRESTPVPPRRDTDFTAEEKKFISDLDMACASPIEERSRLEEPVVERVRLASPVVEPVRRRSPVTETVHRVSPVAETVRRESLVQQVSPVVETVRQESPVAETIRRLSPSTQIPRQVSPVTDIVQRVSPVADIVRRVSPVADIVQRVSPVAETVQRVSPLAETRRHTSPVVETGRHISPVADTVHLETPDVEPVQLEPPVVEDVRRKSLGVETVQTESPVVDDVYRDSSDAQSSDLDTSSVNDVSERGLPVSDNSQDIETPVVEKSVDPPTPLSEPSELQTELENLTEKFDVNKRALSNVGRSASSEEHGLLPSSIYGRTYGHYFSSGEKSSSLDSPNIYSTRSFDNFGRKDSYDEAVPGRLFTTTSYDRYLSRERSDSPEMPRFSARSYELFGSQERSGSFYSTGSCDDVGSSEHSASPEAYEPKCSRYKEHSPSPLRSSMVVVSSSYDPYRLSSRQAPSSFESSALQPELPSSHEHSTEIERPSSPERMLILRSTSPVHFLKPESSAPAEDAPASPDLSRNEWAHSYSTPTAHIFIPRPPVKPERGQGRSHMLSSSFGSIPRATMAATDRSESLPQFSSPQEQSEEIPTQQPVRPRRPQRPPGPSGDRPEKPPRPSSFISESDSVGPSGDRPERPERPQRPPQPNFAAEPSSQERVMPKGQSGVPSSPVAPRRPPRPQPPPPPPPFKPRHGSSTTEDTHL